ncbi:MAG: IS66 family transposase [Shewanella fodinae]|nr:IS66 family transposase [Shewanella fodinae]
MQKSIDNLPDDPAALKEIIRQMQMNEAALQGQLTQKLSQISLLNAQLQLLRRSQFGRSSERVDRYIHQLELQLEELEINVSEITATLPEPLKLQQPRRREQLPEHLPREEHLVDVGCQCPDCGGQLTHIGDDVAEILDVRPVRFRVIKTVRPKYSCPKCESLHQAPAPARVVPKGLASANMLTKVLVDKYLDHQPLYRQVDIMKREGVALERSTLADWVGHASFLLQPLTELIGKHVLASDKVHADDTTAPTLSPGKGRTATGRYWTYVRDNRPCGDESPPAVWLKYSENRQGIHPEAHLKGFKGIIQADAFAGYNSVYGGKVIAAGCWAHVRRKFYDLTQSGPAPMAEEALQQIQALYAIEADIRGLPPDERARLRQLHASPLLENLHDWMNRTLRGSSKGSPLSKAIQYALKQWDALLVYVRYGQAEIDNNTAECVFRPIMNTHSDGT